MFNLGNLWMPTKAVIFDMFDTLMPIEGDHAFYEPALRMLYEVLVRNGANVPYRKFRQAYAEARDELFSKADENLEEPHFNLRVAGALRRLGYNYDPFGREVSEATRAFCEEFMKYVRLDEDAVDVLKKLHGKFKLGIVSNFAIPECVYKLLERHSMSEFFDAVIVSGAVNKRKPSPEIFKRALEILNVKPEEAVFVGDTLDADIKGAKQAGMKAVFLERRKQEAYDAYPDGKIESLTQLLRVLEDGLQT
jgi:putative hydrolase of the HAD superfamily